MKVPKKTVFITGATSGIGKAIATKLAEAGHRIIICGRRTERLQEIKHLLQNQYNTAIYAMPLDVRHREEVRKSIAELPTAWKNIDVLVNNAGLAAGLDNFQEADIDDWERMIDTNLKGLLYVTKAVLPLMIGNTDKHIINIGSTAGKEVYEKGNVYCATKHAVDALTKAMRIDLLEHGIKVTAINPGATETEFSLVRFKGNEQRAKEVYRGFHPLQAEDIAEVVHWLLTLPSHVCVNDITLTSLAQANSFYIKRKD